MLVNSWSVAQDVLIDTSTTDEACNTVDASARSIIEQYLGSEVPDFSLYNTTRDGRTASVDTLEAVILDYLSGAIDINVNLIAEIGTTYGMSLAGYLVPGILCFLFCIFLGLPVFVIRCCCARKCCIPHHPLWGEEPGTLEDFPEPKCCGASRKLPKGVDEETDVEKWNNGNPTEGTVRPYTYWEQCSPVFFYILFAAALAGFSISGVLAVGTIVSGLDGSVCAIDVLLIDAQTFTLSLSNAIGGMLNTGVAQLDAVATIIDGASSVAGDAATVYDSGVVALQSIDDLIVSSGSTYSFDTSSIDSALSTLSSAGTELDNTLNDVNTLLVEPRQVILGIAGMLEDITNQTNYFFDIANSYMHDAQIEIPAIPMLTDGTPISGALGVTGVLENNAYTLGSVFFVLCLVSIPFTTFGILVMGPKCAHKPHNEKSKTGWQCCGLLFSRISCCWLFVVLIIACIPSLILFPLSIIVTDTCVIFERFGADHASYLNNIIPMLSSNLESDGGLSSDSDSSSSGYSDMFSFDIVSGTEAALGACFANTSLLDALNITDTLYSYVAAVDFSILDSLDVASLIDITAINSQLNEVTSSMDIYTVLAPYDADDETALTSACDTCSDFGAAADALNAVPFFTVTITTSDKDSMNSCSDCVSGIFSATDLPGSTTQACGVWQQVFCEVGGNITDFSNSLDVVQSNFAEVETGLNLMYNNMNVLQNELVAVATNIEIFAQSVYGLDEYAFCGWLIEFYDAMIMALCPGSTSGLLWLSYALNLTCTTVLCMIVSILLINCRLGGVGQPKHHSNPQNFHPKNLGNFFKSSFNGGGSTVHPEKSQKSGSLNQQEKKEAEHVIQTAKRDDTNSDTAGVAV
jgi:hypothetical protein